VTVAEVSAPAAAAEMMPSDADTTPTDASTVLWLVAPISRSPLMSTVLQAMYARVVPRMVLVRLTPPPANDTPERIVRLAEIAAACASAVTVASSLAPMVAVPDTPSSVTELRYASTRLSIVLFASATPMAAALPVAPMAAATEAAMVVASIVDTSPAVTDRSRATSIWERAELAISARTVMDTLLVAEAPAPAAAIAAPPAARATAPASTVASMSASEAAPTTRSRPASTLEAFT
jgi:hypothetical protein